jgi:hypothetical protein
MAPAGLISVSADTEAKIAFFIDLLPIFPAGHQFSVATRRLQTEPRATLQD